MQEAGLAALRYHRGVAPTELTTQVSIAIDAPQGTSGAP